MSNNINDPSQKPDGDLTQGENLPTVVPCNMPVPTEPPTKKKSKLPIIIASVIVLAAAVAAVIAFIGSDSGKEHSDTESVDGTETEAASSDKPAIEKELEPVGSAEESDTVISEPQTVTASPTAYHPINTPHFYTYRDHKLTVYHSRDAIPAGTLEFNGKSSINAASSPSGDAVIADETRVVYINGGVMTALSVDDRDATSDLLALSENGGVIMYKNTLGGWSLYNAVDKVTAASVSEDVSDAVLSPSGTAVLYLALPTSSTEDPIPDLYCFANNSTKRLSDGITPLAISDDGSIAWAENEGLLFRFANDGVTEYAVSSDNYILSGDKTELMYSSDSEVVLVDKNGDTHELIKCEENQSIKPIVPENASVAFAGLCDRAYEINGSCYYLLKNHSLILLTEDAEHETVTMDGRLLYFIKDEKLMSIELNLLDENTSSVTPTIVTDAEISDYKVSANGKGCYIDVNGDLYSFDGGLIRETVKSIDMMSNGTLVYLFRSKNPVIGFDKYMVSTYKDGISADGFDLGVDGDVDSVIVGTDFLCVTTSAVLDKPLLMKNGDADYVMIAKDVTSLIHPTSYTLHPEELFN